MTALNKVEIPESPEYERGIINLLINFPDSAYKITSSLTDHHFYSELRRTIYKIIKRLIEENKPADIITVLEQVKILGDEKIPAKAVEEEYQSIIDLFGTEDSITFYADELERYYKLRALFKLFNGYSGKFLDKECNSEETLSKFYSEVTSLEVGRNKLEVICIRDYCSEYMEDLENRGKFTTGKLIGIPSGFIDIDLMTAGWKGGEYITLAARPSMGKSALGVNFAENAAFLRPEDHILIISMESDRKSIMNRMVASNSKIPLGNIRAGQLTAMDWSYVNKTLNKLYNTNLKIVDATDITIEDIYMLTLMCKRTCNLQLLIIDYMQLISDKNKKGYNRTERVTEISRKIKLIAKEINIPIISLAQLSRECEKRNDKRPQLSDLRESSSLEMDSDVVIFIYRDEMYLPTTPENENVAEVTIAKQRDGPTGMVKLKFLKEYTKFVTRLSADDLSYTSRKEYEEEERSLI